MIAPNEAVHLAKIMRASACARYVCLAAENYRFNPLGNDSTRHIRSAANRLCRIPLNQPSTSTNLANPPSTHPPTFKTHNMSCPRPWCQRLSSNALIKAPQQYAEALPLAFSRRGTSDKALALYVDLNPNRPKFRIARDPPIIGFSRRRSPVREPTSTATSHTPPGPSQNGDMGI